MHRAEFRRCFDFVIGLFPHPQKGSELLRLPTGTARVTTSLRSHTVAKQHSCAPQLEFLLTGEVHTLDTLDAIAIFDRLAWQVDASG